MVELLGWLDLLVNFPQIPSTFTPFMKKMCHFSHFLEKKHCKTGPKAFSSRPASESKSTAVGPLGVKTPVSREGNPATETTICQPPH